MNKYHTVKTLQNKLNELIEKGYGDYDVCITYDNGYGVTFAHKEVEPKVETHNKDLVIFAEDDKFVRGFKDREW